MTAELELAYRRALRWYPKNWRTHNEDAVVGTLLDQAADAGESTRATKSDLRNLRVHGLSQRLGFVGRFLTPAVRRGISIGSLASGFTISAWSIVFSITNTVVADKYPDIFGTAGVHTFGPFTSFGIILYGVWLLAFAAGLVGWGTAMRVLLVATVPAAIVARFVSEWTRMSQFPSTTHVTLLVVFAIGASLALPQRTARWRVTTLVASALAMGILVYSMYEQQWMPALDSRMFFERMYFAPGRPLDGWICGVAPVLIILCLAMSRWTWAAVLTVLTLPWFALCLWDVSRHGDLGTLAVWVLIAAAIAAIVTAIALHGRYRLTITRR